MGCHPVRRNSSIWHLPYVLKGVSSTRLTHNLPIRQKTQQKVFLNSMQRKEQPATRTKHTAADPRSNRASLTGGSSMQSSFLGSSRKRPNHFSDRSAF